MKYLLSLCLLLVPIYSLQAQSSNYRAQGKYYTAKDHYTTGSYISALNSIYAAKDLLSGTNYKLQYLHVMSAYNAGRYQEAQSEMNRYFNLVDEIEEPVGFKKIVEQLTPDETKSLTKLIDRIDAKAESQGQAPPPPPVPERDLVEDIEDALDAIESFSYRIVDQARGHKGDKKNSYTYKIDVEQKSSAIQVTIKERLRYGLWDETHTITHRLRIDDKIKAFHLIERRKDGDEAVFWIKVEGKASGYIVEKTSSSGTRTTDIIAITQEVGSKFRLQEMVETLNAVLK